MRVHAHAEVEPRSKNSITEVEERTFQHALARGLGTRMGFRSPVVLELDLFARANNPPEIQTVTKTYLDLTYRAPVGKGRLIGDDRQVRHLAVRYFTDGAKNAPSVFLRATRMSCFRQDVKLARAVWSDDENGPLADDDDGFEHSMEEFRRWESQRESIEATYGGTTVELHRRFLLARLQQRWLAGTERLLHSILLDLLSGVQRTELSEVELGGVRLPAIDVEDVHRQFLFTPGISLELGSLPRRSGEGAAFRQSISHALMELVASSPCLFPLLTQLAVTILVVAPKTRDNDLGIDLDNVAKRVIPLVHRTLEPPGRHPLPDPAAINDPGLRAWCQAEAIRARRLPKHHVTRFEVIEVPRTERDPESGYVRLALCNGNGRTFVEFVCDTIKKWEERLTD